MRIQSIHTCVCQSNRGRRKDDKWEGSCHATAGDTPPPCSGALYSSSLRPKRTLMHTLHTNTCVSTSGLQSISIINSFITEVLSLDDVIGIKSLKKNNKLHFYASLWFSLSLSLLPFLPPALSLSLPLSFSRNKRRLPTRKNPPVGGSWFIFCGRCLGFRLCWELEVEEGWVGLSGYQHWFVASTAWWQLFRCHSLIIMRDDRCPPWFESRWRRAPASGFTLLALADTDRAEWGGSSDRCLQFRGQLWSVARRQATEHAWS